MKDYAANYKTWITHKPKSVQAKELRYQTKIYDDIRRHVNSATKRLDIAFHDVNLCQKQLQYQAMLMREI